MILSFKGKVILLWMDKTCSLSFKIASAYKFNVGGEVSQVVQSVQYVLMFSRPFPLDACSWYEEDQVRHSRGDRKMAGRKKKVSKALTASNFLLLSQGWELK
jgi:hypothetical protein